MRQLSLSAIRPDKFHEASTSLRPDRRWRLSRPVRRLARLSIGRMLSTFDTPAASNGATDQELVRLTGPLGRLAAEDVRWDLIGAAHSGRRHRV